MTELVEIANGKAKLNLHPGQTRAWDSKKRFIFVLAGTQGGKTSFGPWWLWREIQNLGAGDYLAATSSYDIFKLKMLPEMINVFIHILDIGRYWSGDKVIELKDPKTGRFRANLSSDPMWGRIILRSASSEGGLESTTAKAAWLDEVGQDEFRVTAYEAVLRRLSIHGGRILATTTIYNLGWMKQLVYDAWQQGDPDIDVIQFPSTLNPAFPHHEFERMRDRMPGWKFRMFYEGLYARPAGLIYSDFVDEYRAKGGHKVEPFDIPQEWPRFVGIDPGAVNTAILWIAVDVQHNVLYVYRESLEGGKSTREHASQALNIANKYAENVVIWAVGAKSEEQQRMDWYEAGVAAIAPPVHDVESGIDKVIELLRQHRVFFFDTLRGVLDELATYSRVLDDMGEPTEKIKNKEKFHRLDALRYGVLGTQHTYEEAGGINYGEADRFDNSPY